MIPKMGIEEQFVIQEVASAGLKSMEHFIRFKQVINLSNRTSHAHFRRAPSQSQLKHGSEKLNLHLSQ